MPTFGPCSGSRQSQAEHHRHTPRGAAPQCTALQSLPQHICFSLYTPKAKVPGGPPPNCVEALCAQWTSALRIDVSPRHERTAHTIQHFTQLQSTMLSAIACQHFSYSQSRIQNVASLSRTRMWICVRVRTAARRLCGDMHLDACICMRIAI